MLAFLLIIALLNVPAFFAPSAPVEPPPEPPPIVENVEARASGAVSVNKLEAAGGLCIFAACGYAGFRLSRIGARRKRIIKTDNAAFVALMRRLDTLARIMEGVTDNE